VDLHHKLSQFTVQGVACLLHFFFVLGKSSHKFVPMH
jgi:hypothetical protein